MQATFKFCTLFVCSLALLAMRAAAQDPVGGAALIKTADPDAEGFLVLPLPKPTVIDGKLENAAQFENKKMKGRSDILKLLRSELPLDASDQLRVENYFNGFEFRLLTQTAPEDLEKLPKLRFDLFKLYIQVCKHPANHQKLIDLTLAMMQQIVMNKFHPIVRYNAMIIIGELNEQEVLRVGAHPLMPEPYSAALNFIVDRVEDANTPDAIRVAALVGVIRHLEWEPYRAPGNPIPPATRTTMINALIKLAEMKTPPAGRTPAGHNWLRRRAIEALGLAGVTTSLPNVVASVEKLLKDQTEPLQLRCGAALALGQMNVPPGLKVDAIDLSRTLGNLAAACIKAEFDRIDSLNRTEEEHRAVYNTLGDGGAGGGIPAGPGYGEGIILPGQGNAGLAGDLAPDPKGYRLEPVRKRLRFQLYCVQVGLGYPLDKVGAIPPPPQTRKGAQRIATLPAEKKAAEDILAAVNKLVDLIEKNKIDLIQLENDLKASAKVLAGVVARATPAAVAAPVDPLAPMPGVPAVKPAAANSDDDLLGAPAPKR